MTGPGASSASRMRIAGIALLALAVVAALIGLLSIGSTGTPTPTAAPTSADPGAAPGSGAPLPGAVTPPPAVPGEPSAGAPVPPVGGSGAPPALGATPPPAAPPIVPSDGGGGAAPGGGTSAGVSDGGTGGGAQAGSFASVPVRVLNNSRIVGLADRAAAELRARGWNVVQVGNYPDGIIPESTAYYRPGTDEEAAAQALASQFGIRANPRFPGITDATPGLIVMATNNWDAAPKGG